MDTQEAKQESEKVAADTDRTAVRSEFAAADSALSSSVATRMATEEARVDAILAASDADKDSFAEIVTLINSVDTENDDAFAAYVLSNNAAVAAGDANDDNSAGDIAAILVASAVFILTNSANPTGVILISAAAASGTIPTNAATCAEVIGTGV